MKTHYVDFISKKNKGISDNRQVALANVITMGDAKSKRVSKFHYLFTFVSQFDDPHWETLPYSSSEIGRMKQAIDVIRSDRYRRGKQYILTSPVEITHNYISNCLDSILMDAGEGDFIFLYLSSHGEKDGEEQFHFITKDTYRDRRGDYINTLSKTDINNYVNLLTAKKAKVLFFLDACYAGAVMDNEIHGEAAYYLSTNGDNPAYSNRLSGSPFAIALTEVLTGSLNDKFKNCFKDDQVQVGSLGNYLSNTVFDKSEQHAISDGHSFNPYFVLWNIQKSSPKESLIIRELAEQAKQNPAKLIDLGDRYYKGKGTPIDYYKAFDCYKKASLSKDKEVKAKALLKLSDCFFYGNPEQDTILSFEYALEAAKLGNVQAMEDLTYYYVNGVGTKKNVKEGIQWLMKAVKKNSPKAQCELGRAYYDGDHFPKDPKKAVEWYTKSAEQGYSKARQRRSPRFKESSGMVRKICGTRKCEGAK